MPKRSTSRQPDPPTFFIDRDLGPTEDCRFIEILRAGGMQVEPHNDHFPTLPAPEDHVWLQLCADRGWVSITHDKAIRYEPLALSVIFEGGVQQFVCIGAYDHPKLAQNLVNTRHKIAAFVRRHDYPFIARLYMQRDPERYRRGVGGEIRLYHDREWYDHWRARR